MCDHIGTYVRRTLGDGTVHFCVQCARCLQLLKLTEHDSRPYIRVEEIPAGRTIGEWIDGGAI